MAIPAGAIQPLIQAGAQLAGQGLNAGMQGAMNRKQRKWQEAQYDKQRQHALADWNMMNEYNSPAAQMERLKAAGLNPNLVYGKGADNTAPAVRSSDSGQWNPTPAQFDLGGVISSYQDATMKQAQTNNLKTQNAVLTQEAALKAAQTANVITQNKRGEFDLGLATELRKTSLDAAVQNLRKITLEGDRTQAETGIALQKNERDAALNSSNLREAAERILKLRADTANTRLERYRIQQQIEGLKKDNTLKDLDIQLRRIGINPHDNIFARILGRILGDGERRGIPKRHTELDEPDMGSSFWRDVYKNDAKIKK